MRFARVDVEGAARWAVLDDRAVHLPSGAPYDGGWPTGENLALGDVRLLAPATPSKILCIGRNYPAHRTENVGVAGPRLELYIDEKPALGTTDPTFVDGRVGVLSYQGSQIEIADLVVTSSRPTIGIHTSQVLDSGQSSGWRRFEVQVSMPAAGAVIVAQLRAGDTAEPDATWAAFQTASDPDAVVAVDGRYAQYRILMSTGHGSRRPQIRTVRLRRESLIVPPHVSWCGRPPGSRSPRQGVDVRARIQHTVNPARSQSVTPLENPVIGGHQLPPSFCVSSMPTIHLRLPLPRRQYDEIEHAA